MSSKERRDPDDERLILQSNGLPRRVQDINGDNIEQISTTVKLLGITRLVRRLGDIDEPLSRINYGGSMTEDGIANQTSIVPGPEDDTVEVISSED